MRGFIFGYFHENKDKLILQYEKISYSSGLCANKLERYVRKIIEGELHRPTAKAQAIAFILRNAALGRENTLPKRIPTKEEIIAAEKLFEQV